MKKNRITSVCRIILCMLSFSTPAFSADIPTWNMDKSKSTLHFSATQNNAPLKGKFKQFDAVIQFDKNQLEHSHIEVVVDLSSVSTDYDDVSQTLKTAPWFDTQQFPKAKFVSTSITQTGDNHYEAKGNLTLKSITYPMTLNFNFNSYSDYLAIAGGHATLLRTSYQVGTGEWTDTSNVQDEVAIDFVIYASR